MSISESYRWVPVAMDPKRSNPIILELASASGTKYSIISTCLINRFFISELTYKDTKWRLMKIF
ncbi:MAG: hypothetical protein EPN88_12190 [Bacteroidetes bacterium]|nr:MAG: hypothetical protein EPN88_12190 [Bacteroidota bacterium]